jgi:hypothetical protein
MTAAKPDKVCCWHLFTVGASRHDRSTLRVGGDVPIPTPHSPGRADFRHPVLHGRVSLTAV